MPPHPINGKVFYPGYIETSILRLRIVSFPMDTWYLVSLVTYVNWLGFLENFLVPSTLQQVHAKSSVNTCECEYLFNNPVHENLFKGSKLTLAFRFSLKMFWPSAQVLAVVFWCHVSINPTIERSLIIEVKEKSYCTSDSMVWLYGYRDYWIIWKQPSWRCWPKKLFILTSWGLNRSLVWTEGCWSTSSNLLANYLYTTYREISKYRIIITFLNQSVRNYLQKINSKTCIALL